MPVRGSSVAPARAVARRTSVRGASPLPQYTAAIPVIRRVEVRVGDSAASPTAGAAGRTQSLQLQIPIAVAVFFCSIETQRVAHDSRGFQILLQIRRAEERSIFHLAELPHLPDGVQVKSGRAGRAEDVPVE